MVPEIVSNPTVRKEKHSNISALTLIRHAPFKKKKTKKNKSVHFRK